MVVPSKGRGKQGPLQLIASDIEAYDGSPRTACYIPMGNREFWAYKMSSVTSVDQRKIELYRQLELCVSVSTERGSTVIYVGNLIPFISGVYGDGLEFEAKALPTALAMKANMQCPHLEAVVDPLAPEFECCQIGDIYLHWCMYSPNEAWRRNVAESPQDPEQMVPREFRQDYWAGRNKQPEDFSRSRSMTPDEVLAYIETEL
jgi:hypothetical protein